MVPTVSRSSSLKKKQKIPCFIYEGIEDLWLKTIFQIFCISATSKGNLAKTTTLKTTMTETTIKKTTTTKITTKKQTRKNMYTTKTTKTKKKWFFMYVTFFFNFIGSCAIINKFQEWSLLCQISCCFLFKC